MTMATEAPRRIEAIDWQDLIDAYRDGDAELPQSWTPAHVMMRLATACKVLLLLPGRRVGPSTSLSYWPATLAEFSDRVSAQAGTDAPKRPKPAEVTLMEEALSWPTRYLTRSPLMADAVMVYAMVAAAGIELSPFIRERKVGVLDQLRSAEETRQIRLRVLAARISKEAKASAEHMPAEDMARLVITRAAHERFQKEAQALGLLRRPELKDIASGKCLTVRTLHTERKKAAEIIAVNLRRSKIEIR